MIFIDINMHGLSGDKGALKSAGASYPFEKPGRLNSYVDTVKKIMDGP